MQRTPNLTVATQTAAEAAYARGDLTAAIAAYERLDPQALSAPLHLHFAHALALTGELERAERLAMDHVSRFGSTAAACSLAAAIAQKRGDHGRCLSFAAVAEQLEQPGGAANRLVYAALAHLGALPEAIGALGRLIAFGAQPSYTEVNDLCALYGLAGQPDTIPALVARLPPSDARPGEPRLLVAMPKSGGATIAASVASRCGAMFTGVGVDLPDWAGFPAPWLHPDLVGYFAGRQVMLLSHAAALARNQAALARFPLPIVVHLRDPRDALLSLFEMGESYGGLQFLRFARCCPGYALLSPADRLGVLRERVYPIYLQWIDSWLQIADREPGAVTFSTYEAFLEDPEALVARLAVRYGADPGTDAQIHSVHFRQGRSGAHRGNFTAAQSRDMFDALPGRAGERFGWQP